MSKPTTAYADPLVGALNETAWALSALKEADSLQINPKLSHTRDHLRAVIKLLNKALEDRKEL
jgi:hypothetical protein